MGERTPGSAQRGAGSPGLIAALLATVLVVSWAWRSGATERPLRVVMDDNYPPYAFRNAHGALQGILVDLWNLWQQRTGRAVELVGMDWGEAQARMDSGDFDVIDTIFFNEDRGKRYDFTKPYAQIDVPIFFHRNISGIVDVASLQGFRVAAKRGDNAVGVLRRSGVSGVVEYDRYEQIIRAARDGQVMVFVVDRPPALYFLYKFGIQDQFRTAAPLPGGEFHRAVPKGDGATLALVQGGFAKISPEEHRDIEQKWYGAPLVDRSWVRLFLLGAGGAAALVLSLAFWGWSLRRIVRRKTAELQAQIQIAEAHAEAWRQSEERHRLLVENVSEGIAVQQDDRFRFVNSAMTAISGWSREELLAQDPLLLVHPEDRPLVNAYYTRRMRGDGDVPSRYDFRVIGKRGDLLWIAACIVVIEWEGAPATLDFYADITERKEVEASLRESEERYRQLYEAESDAIFLIDNEEGRIVEANPAAETLYGYARAELLALRNTDLSAEPESTRAVTRHGASLIPLRYHRKKDGSVFPVEITGRFFSWKGRPVHIAAIRDISARVRADESLRESEERLRFVLEGSNLGFWDWNLVTGEVTRNREWAEMVGYAFDEVQSSVLQWENIVHPEDLPAAWRSIRDHLEGRTPIHAMEYRIRTKAGGYRWVLDRARVMARDPEGRALRMCGTHTDVTARKEAEERMRYLSYHDVLTDLRNRASFEEEMERLDGRPHGTVGLFVFDVDGLKLVNDSFGHDQGDLLLQNAAQAIGDALRGGMVARIGGDEFGAILPGAGEPEMEAARDRLLVGVEPRAIDVRGIHVPLHLAIGYAVSPGPEVTMREAFRIADDRMYRDKLHRRGSARGAMVQILKQMLAERDFITEGHGERLSTYALALGKALGMAEAELPDLRLFAQFHDIGKVGIPDRILQKPGPLSPEEQTEMRRHAEVGQRIAQSSPELAPISEWILLHHEWWDGGGYPLGLSGERIPLPCRMLAIVDAFDAMTSDRPYRKAMTQKHAVAELQRGSGTQFEPRLVEIFVDLLETGLPTDQGTPA